MGAGASQAKREEMPLFRRRQSGEAKKRMEHQLYLARESRGLTFDLSKCELSEVPGGVFSLCRVMLKEVLLLHDNFLRSLSAGGKLKDLEHLRVLDLHNNELPDLPEEFSCLQQLQMLNLQGNKLSKFPSCILQLHHLQSINLKDNKIKELPSAIREMCCLRSIDISGTKISQLPVTLCEIRTLENVGVTCRQMVYPPYEICEGGTVDMMKFLCAEHGIEYEPPTKHSIHLLDHPDAKPAQEVEPDSSKEDEILQYERMKDERRQKLLALEKQLDDEKVAQTQLALKANQEKISALDALVKEESRLLSDLSRLQMMKDAERKEMVNSLALAEQSATLLVQELLEMNEKAAWREDMMEAMERERCEAELWFVVHQDESACLRKKEIINAMGNILGEAEQFEAARQRYELSRELSKKRAQTSLQDSERAVQSVLNNRRDDILNLNLQLGREEELQKHAFEALLRSRDNKTQRLMNQILLVENQLCIISSVEIDRRMAKAEVETQILDEKREALVDLLKQLCEARDRREAQLRKQLVVMEEQREHDQTDYWLIQYQRLLDRKPKELIDEKLQLEKAVLQILEEADATDFIPHFQRHRITIETLCALNEDELSQVGVNLVGVRHKILRSVEEYLQRTEKRKSFEDDSPSAATAPPDGDSMPVVQARMESECCVCFDEKAVLLFLYCGHVCCCSKCGAGLQLCPLCRENVQQRVIIQA